MFSTYTLHFVTFIVKYTMKCPLAYMKAYTIKILKVYYEKYTT